jgi:tetrahydromethanopterin S-methyltransferase subunit D
MEDISERFRMNWQGYVRQYRVFLFLTIPVTVADAASTIYFMCRTGPDTEGHPTIRLVSTIIGPILGPVLSKLIQLTIIVTLTVYLHRWAIYIFVAVIILYAWAAWYNVWGCDLYYPRLLDWLDHISL